jgi:hypothetical protein
MAESPVVKLQRAGPQAFEVLIDAVGPNRSVDLLKVTPGSRHSRSANDALQTVPSHVFCVGRRVKR